MCHPAKALALIEQLKGSGPDDGELEAEPAGEVVDRGTEGVDDGDTSADEEGGVLGVDAAGPRTSAGLTPTSSGI
jgi:hypothetical protein